MYHQYRSATTGVPVTLYHNAHEALDAGARFVYHIPDNAYQDSAGVVPSAVFENTAGHYPMLGNGAGASPWYWGKTLDEARAVAADANARRGITPEEAQRIVDSSIMATLALRAGGSRS